MKRYTIYILSFCVIFFSCKKDQIDEGDCGVTNHKNELTGEWKWVKTQGGLAPTTTTPASTGKNISISLNADQTYSIKTNGSITSSGTYQMESRICIHDHQSKTWVKFSSDQGMMIEKMENNELHLSEDVYDGYLSQYKKY